MKAVKRIRKRESKLPQIMLGVVISVIMVSSILGYIGMRGSSGSESYNGFRFTQLPNGLYATTINGKQLRFYFLPQQLEPLPFNRSLIAPVRNTRLIYITSDFNASNAQAIAEAEYHLGVSLQGMGIMSIPAYTTNTTTSRQVITCQNASVFIPVIYFRKGVEPGLASEENCIHIIGKERAELLAVTDRVIYSLLGIMQ